MLTPIGKRITVKPIEIKHGALIVHNTKPKQFMIISIGDEVTKVKAGDTIFLEKHYGVEIEHENEKVLVIDENSILAKLACAQGPSLAEY
jgi:co-chaperonin GroES (HSP10)